MDIDGPQGLGVPWEKHKPRPPHINVIQTRGLEANEVLTLALQEPRHWQLRHLAVSTCANS